ncbi:MAG TPA: MauE/DoxX family redox-associated membrane protein [Candidatus Angelobacter sp.]|nr:MauE/DoxX family redox-associated membrane protein [Candidatus Angelobacter sp.]
MTKPLIVRTFLQSAATLLIITALAKFISATGHARILEQPDPVFGIRFALLFWIVGSAELAVAFVCLFAKKLVFPAGSLAWLTANFAIYRFGLWWVNYQKPCPCLGHLTDALRIPPSITDVALKSALIYMSAGSFAILVWLWMQHLKASKVQVVMGMRPQEDNPG